MRKIVAVCVVAGLILSSVAPMLAQQQSAPKQDKKPAVQQAADSYVCPMHPEEKSTKPGKCSKCGMALEKKTVKPAQMKKGGMKHEGKSKCDGCQEACGEH
jgi:hypothetical protein